MRSNKLFPGFEEPVIDFPPTFKYDVPKSKHHHHLSHRRDKEGRESKEKERSGKERGVRASLRAARRSKRRKEKEKEREKEKEKGGVGAGIGKSESSKPLRPLAEQCESGSSSDPDQEQEQDGEDDSEGDADSFSSRAQSQRMSGTRSQRPPSTRSQRPTSIRSQPLSTPTLPRSSLDPDGWGDPQPDSSDGEDASFVNHNTQMNAAPAPAGLARMLSQGAKRGWRALGALSPTPSERRKGGLGMGTSSDVAVGGRRGVSTGPEAILRGGLGVPGAGGGGMGRSQPNLVVDTGVVGATSIGGAVGPGRASMDGFATGGGLSPLSPGTGVFGSIAGGVSSINSNTGLIPPPPVLRASSSAGSVALVEDSGENNGGEDVKGVYDTSSKQRVPSWYVPFAIMTLCTNKRVIY